MSILINMEMPKSCYACDMLELSGVVGCNHAYDTKNSDWGRALNCPLASVPPHGRCIDADEFLKRAIGTKCFRGDYALMLEELVGESTTIIQADPKEEV